MHQNNKSTFRRVSNRADAETSNKPSSGTMSKIHRVYDPANEQPSRLYTLTSVLKAKHPSITSKSLSNERAYYIQSLKLSKRTKNGTWYLTAQEAALVYSS